LLLFFCTAASAVALYPSFANREAGEYAGKPYVIAIDWDQIMSLPRWKPQEGEPKIGPGEAWKRARAALQKVVQHIERFEAGPISLQQVGLKIGSNDDRRFVYVVNFADLDSVVFKANETHIDHLSVWVSTDGAVFLPRMSTGNGDEYVR
jgi:hypothetical protein